MPDTKIPKITARRPASKMPEWAILQRSLIALMNESEDLLIEHYLQPNGEIFWPDIEGFGGYGGVDNAFEGFHRWPLFYLLGGDDRFLQLAQRQYDVLVDQFSRYERKGSTFPPGRNTMLVQEYLPDFDWMHAGEAALYFYFLNLADPTNPKNRDRSVRFAGFLTDEDPTLPESSYDAEHRVFRTSAMGSNGPAFHRFDRPYGYGTWMDSYGLAFYDVPGVETMLDLRDPEKAQRFGEVYSARLKHCDTVTNMLSTSMVMNAYLHTGDDKYKQWVLDYVGGWRTRYAGNDGIMPDNAGPTGILGETIDGKWYGGHYGWSFPHGFQFIADAMVVGGENERLLTGEKDRLRWVREQTEMLLTHAIEDQDGRLLVPQKYADPDAVIEYGGANEPMTRPDRVTSEENFTRKKQIDGWFEFGALRPVHMAHVYADSIDPHDLEVARNIRDKTNNTWDRVVGSVAHGKHLGGQDHAYLNFLAGDFPQYPVEILLHSISQVFGQLKKLREELQTSDTGWGYRPDGDKAWQEVAEVTRQINEMKQMKWSESVTHSYFQTYLIGRSTIVTEALIQLTLGGPMPIYNGGLLKTAIRHFDADRKRPGLPPDVAVLVQRIDAEGIDLTLVNLHPMEDRRLIVQAGAFAEHLFTTATYTDDAGAAVAVKVHGEYVEFDLAPGVVFDVNLGMQRYCRQPSYQLPWDRYERGRVWRSDDEGL
jgi:hypothetical protein